MKNLAKVRGFCFVATIEMVEKLDFILKQQFKYNSIILAA